MTFRLGFAFFLALAAPVLRAADRADILFSEGKAAFDRGEFAGAVDRFSKALLHRPEDPRAQKYLILAGQKLVQERSAEKIPLADLQKIVDEAQQVLEQRRNEMRQAVEMLRRAQKNAEAGSAADTLRACRGVELLMHVTLGDDAESRRIQEYLHSLCAELESTVSAGILLKEADVQRVLGYVAYCESDWAAARAHWDKALAAAPQDAHLAELRDSAAQREARQQAMDKAHDLFDRAQTALVAGEDDQALPLLEEASRLDPYNESVLLAWERTQARVNTAARLSAVKRHRQDALAGEEKGQWLEAAQGWLAILSQDPLNEEAKARLERIRLALSDSLGEASAGTRGTVEKTEEAEQMYTLGLLRYSEGRLVEAAENFQRSLQAQPDHAYARKALERVREELEAL